MLQEYLDELAEGSAPVIVVAQPRRVLQGDTRERWDAAFFADLEPRVREKDFPLWDMRTRCPTRIS